MELTYENLLNDVKEKGFNVVKEVSTYKKVKIRFIFRLMKPVFVFM